MRDQASGTSIRLLAPRSPVLYDHTLSVEELTQRSGASGKPNQHALGLTTVTVETRLRLDKRTLMDPRTGMMCTRPTVTVTLGGAPQTVHIGKEFPADSCAYREVAEHELRHVHANEAQAEFVANDFQSAMKAEFGNRVFFGSEKELERAIDDKLQNDWLPRIETEFALVRLAHESIDTPEEAARAERFCDGAVSRMLQDTTSADAGDLSRGAAFQREWQKLEGQHRALLAPVDSRIAQFNLGGMISVETLTVAARRDKVLTEVAALRRLVAARRALVVTTHAEAMQLLDAKLPLPNKAARMATFTAQYEARMKSNDGLDAAELSLLRVIEETLQWSSVQRGLDSRQGRIQFANGQQQAEFGAFQRRLVTGSAAVNEAAARNATALE